jgi:5-(aminomethyl)-3-furanmethanol phosphate kinase
LWGKGAGEGGSQNPPLTYNIAVKLSPLCVVKIGGSLFDAPNLRAGLWHWLRSLAGNRVLIVTGGGVTADGVRELDRIHSLTSEASHWIALRTLSVSAEFLSRLLFDSPLVPDVPIGVGEWNAMACDRHGGHPSTMVLDGYKFAVRDEHRIDSLPHSWDVTSDSVAARAAAVGRASRLVLLKSTDIPPGTPWDVAADRGWVDAYFPTAVADATFPIEAINFRKWLDEHFPTDGPG